MHRIRYIIRGFPVLLILLIGACTGGHIDNPEISIDELHEHISFLASDSLKGRFPGTPEDRVAAEYILDQFIDFGLTPLDSFGFQYFDITTSVAIGSGNQLQIGEYNAILNKEFTPLSFSENASLTEELIFAGYGFMIDQGEIVWNDYDGLDIFGKWVMLLRGDPEIDSLNSPYLLYREDRDKVMQAKNLGAGGILLVSGINYNPDDELDELELRQGSVGIPVFQISRDLADQIFKPNDQSIKVLEEELMSKRQPVSFETGIIVSGRSELIQESVQTTNVAVMLEGYDPMHFDEYIIVGAHYDHLGLGGPGSGSRVPDSVGIHYGADDNASGVAAMIEIAEKFSAGRKNLKRSIIFIAFSAEELGLLGSKHFIEDPPVDPGQIKAMLNIDMVGRLTSERNLQIGGVGTSLEGKAILTGLTGEAPFEPALSAEGYGPSDHASFYGKDVPVLFFSTGAHMDYHTPNDRIDGINFEGLKSIGDYIYLVASEIANREENLTFLEAGPKMGSSSNRRKGITLGIMPDFAGNVSNGLRADFVIEGRPAYHGGMQNGDVIVAIKGLPVKNIHDYMYRLSKLKAGETINVEVKRGEKTVLLLIQL